VEGVATIVTSVAELAATSGSFYNQTMALAELNLTKYRLPAKPASRWSPRRARSKDFAPCSRIGGPRAITASKQ